MKDKNKKKKLSLSKRTISDLNKLNNKKMVKILGGTAKGCSNVCSEDRTNCPQCPDTWPPGMCTG